MRRRDVLAVMMMVLMGGEGAMASNPNRSEAEGMFLDLEKRFLEAETIQLGTAIRSEGPINFDMQGTLVLKRGNLVLLDQTGTLDGDAARSFLVSDGRKMRAASISGSLDAETPDALNEGIVIGLTRMGLLHNITVITYGQLPDGTDGKVLEWLEVSGFIAGESETIDGVEMIPISFDLSVGGRPSAEATLWLEKETGLPRKRTQTVRFESGEMKVVETYEPILLDAEIDGGRFVVTETD